MQKLSTKVAAIKVREAAVRACTLSMSGAIAAVVLSHNSVLTAAALVFVWTLFNIGVQLSAPRWVASRSVAAWQAAFSEGLAVGSWGWSRLADAVGVDITLLVSAGLMLLLPLLGRWLRMPAITERGEGAEMLADPKVRLPLTTGAAHR